VTNLGGDEVSPLSDNQKFGMPTLGELNWTSGENVNLLFNASEPVGGDGLHHYRRNLEVLHGNVLIAAIDGNFSLCDYG